MTPQQFVDHVKKQAPAPVYLFLGPDQYAREQCRRVLVERVLPEEMRADGLTRHDLDETSLADVLDDALSMSLFASERLLWVMSAESALPKRGGDEAEKENAAVLAAYLQSPTPGVTMVFDARRFDFDGEDKTKQERVKKFYAAVPMTVEFPRYTVQSARPLAESLAKRRGLRIGPAELDLLVNSLGGDAARLATELEKLSLYAGTERDITEEDVVALVPDASATTIFALVAAAGRNDRQQALALLDRLVREGEYLPLALAFLATQFRLALAAKEQKLKNAFEIQNYFQKQGVAIWKSRAEGVEQTMRAFKAETLRAALERIAAADRHLRDARPDDRIVMEEFVMRLTT